MSRHTWERTKHTSRNKIWTNSVDNINTCLNTAEKRTDEVKVTSVNHPKYSIERQRKRKKYERNIKSYGEQSEKHWHRLAIISGDNRENAGQAIFKEIMLSIFHNWWKKWIHRFRKPKEFQAG